MQPGAPQGQAAGIESYLLAVSVSSCCVSVFQFVPIYYFMLRYKNPYLANRRYHIILSTVDINYPCFLYSPKLVFISLNLELNSIRLLVFQVPTLVKEYIDEVSTQLKMVCDSDPDEWPLEERLAFVHETRHAFGRTALLLSGGASLGAFHAGVVKTLAEHKLLQGHV